MNYENLVKNYFKKINLTEKKEEAYNKYKFKIN
jgi:hypothetical protein